MKTKAATFPVLILAAVLALAACVPLPQPAALQPATPTGAAQAAVLEPPIAEVCNGMAQVLMQSVTVEVTQSAAPVPITDPVTMASGMACRATATGTGEQFAGPDETMKALAAVLTSGGWQEDMNLEAGGPTAVGKGFRSGEIVCLAVAGWQPDASANCASDKPISECKVTPAQQLYTVTLDCAQPATGGWQTLTHAEAGFSIMTPPTWSQQTLPDQNGGAIHGMAFTGPEGGVEVYWGVGFGGACLTETVQVQLAAGETSACHAKNSDGAETWSLIGYQMSGGNSFSMRAYTGVPEAQPSSRDLVLRVLSTLAFMAPAQPQGGAGIANPASQNCVAQGGRLEIEARPDGGQFGVCYFEDNRQCEEWALMRGECPAGGVKVTGYATAAARYCAITGGEYAITGKSSQEDEQGVCTLKGGAQCDAWAYYNGTCAAAGEAPPAVAATQIVTYAPGPPTGEPRTGSCWTSSLAVWRADAWRCTAGDEIYDPCFSADEGVVCGADPTNPADSFLLTLTEPLPAAETPQDAAGHAWLVELADGTVCGFATGATGGVAGERFNYLCPSPDAGRLVVIAGDLQPGAVWLAHRLVVSGSMPDLTVLESAMMPVRTVWR